MEYVLDIFRKRYTDLRLDEWIVLAAIVFVCLCIIIQAFSVLWRLARKLETQAQRSAPRRRSRTNVLETLSEADEFGDVRISHTD